MMLLDVGQRLDSFMPIRQTTDASGASSERRRAYDDGNNSVQGGHSHGHRRDRAGGLGQALRQTLDQLGISVGGRRDGGSSGGTSTGITTTTITITITTSTGANPAVNTTTGGSAPTTTTPVSTTPVTTQPVATTDEPETTTPIKTPAASTSPVPNTDGDTDTAPSASRADLHALMHALFQAVRSEARHGSGHGLSDALGSLAADAANGTAPSALQDAFDRLTGGDSSDSTSADGSTPTLQQFLLALQQNLGGSDSGTGHTLPYQPTGNLLAILA